MGTNRITARRLGALGIAFAMGVIVACGGSDSTSQPTSPTAASATPSPAPLTSTPTSLPSPVSTATPLANSAPPGRPPVGPDQPGDAGFRTFLRRLDGGLQAHGGLAIKTGWKAVDVTCRAEDVPRRSDGAVCLAAGQTYQGVATGNWRSEGGIAPVESVNQRLDQASSTVKAGQNDQFGDGSMRVHAISIAGDTRKTIISAIIARPADTGGGPDPVRVVWVVTWEYGDSRWQATNVLFAYVLADDFLEPPAPDARRVAPNWERYQGN